MKQRITLPPLKRFRDIAPYNRLRMAVGSLGISRRKLLDDMSIAFARHDVEIVYDTGLKFHFKDIDRVFGNDPDMRWVSYFLKSDKDGMPQYMSGELERLVYLYLFLALRSPDIASHIFR